MSEDASSVSTSTNISSLTKKAVAMRRRRTSCRVCKEWRHSQTCQMHHLRLTYQNFNKFHSHIKFLEHLLETKVCNSQRSLVLRNTTNNSMRSTKHTCLRSSRPTIFKCYRRGCLKRKTILKSFRKERYAWMTFCRESPARISSFLRNQGNLTE
jgi:hypothetical protein